ncbi:hypothetical protein BJ741DRAFT_597661 [Chytriomyces cf. hyalinus JEL632]|nr:hypothetical protein BJ741DRAFT_597661 [Chytriomyces cf. hyalinus JEL632]
MPQTIELSQIIPFFGMATSIIFNGLNRPFHIINPETRQPEIHILPWVIQIVYGLAYLVYSQNQGDVFLFVQSIPFLMSGMAQTLHWHPFYNKRIRKFHEYLLFFSMGIVYVTTACTTIYFKIRNEQIGIIASGVMTVLFASLTTLTMALEKLRSVRAGKPRGVEIVVAGAGFANAAFWTAYGFWGISDWVVCSCSIVWLVYSAIHGLLIGYGMYFHGGLETSSDTDGDEDSDIVVDRFNRAPTMDGGRYPPMHNSSNYPTPMASQGDYNHGSAPNSGRISMGRMEMEDGVYLTDHASRSRRTMQPQGHSNQHQGPDFSVAYSP